MHKTEQKSSAGLGGAPGYSALTGVIIQVCAVDTLRDGIYNIVMTEQTLPQAHDNTTRYYDREEQQAGRHAYAVYASAHGGVDRDGEPLPRYSELSERTREAWIAVGTGRPRDAEIYERYR